MAALVVTVAGTVAPKNLAAGVAAGVLTAMRSDRLRQQLPGQLAAAHR